MTTQTARNLGIMGENLACEFLKKRGYQILERNFTCRFGEIDIVVLKDGKIHFCEVKMRSSTTFGTPEEAVNVKKLQRLKKAIECYHQERQYRPWQLDIIALYRRKPDVSRPTDIKLEKIIFYKNIPLLIPSWTQRKFQ